MTSRAEPTTGWMSVVEARVSAAVRALAARDENPDDALRGLYISDEQALALAADTSAARADPRVAEAAEQLGLDALDAAVLAVCAAPELHPRYGRLYAYLQDDVTRRLPSPRLAAELLARRRRGARGRARLLRSPGAAATPGALCVCSPPTRGLPLADRPLKLADRLAAFLLGVGAVDRCSAGGPAAPAGDRCGRRGSRRLGASACGRCSTPRAACRSSSAAPTPRRWSPRRRTSRSS